MVRSRSPSSSPVRSVKSPDGGTGSQSAGTLDQEPAEVPVTVNYCGIPGAGSPPQSAKSVKENASPFKFSYRDSVRKYDRKSPPLTQDKHGSHAGGVAQSSAAEPKAIHPEPRPISPPSGVQSKIRQFNARDRQRPISPPTRDRYRPVSPPRPAYSVLAPIPKPPTASDKFRPKSETADQKAVKSFTSNGESGRFSPSSSTTSGDSTFSSGSSVTTIKAPAAGAFGQAYVSSICSSDESLTESSSLLKEEEKITSPSALCIYFDKKGFPDTLV